MICGGGGGGKGMRGSLATRMGKGVRWRLGEEKREGLLLFLMFSWTGGAAEHGKVSRGSRGR